MDQEKNLVRHNLFKEKKSLKNFQNSIYLSLKYALFLVGHPDGKLSKATEHFLIITLNKFFLKK